MQKSYDSKKLFWNEYLYKLVIKSQLSSIFRNNKLLYARKILDELQRQADKKESLHLTQFLRSELVSLEHFEKAKALHQMLSNKTDYCLRVEKPTVCVYSNDLDWLEEIGYKINADSLHLPDPTIVDYLSKEQNIVVLEKDNGCSLRVTLGVQSNTNWTNWILNNQDKVKIGPILEKNLVQPQRYTTYEGLYFYVRDEKILQMISLLGINIRRIDKIVCKENLDK